MNKDKQKSFQELNEFVTLNELTNDSSVIHFHAFVSINTATSEIFKQKMTVRVNKNVSPRIAVLELHDHKLDPYQYPEQFYPDFAVFTHVDKLYLKIEDTHNSNPAIGKYTVKIFPLEKVE